MTSSSKNFEIIDFGRLEGTPCPCGIAKRGLMDSEQVPYSLHLTEISEDAKAHYHKRLTETYLILECGPEAAIELDGNVVPIQPHTAITIYPGTRHRALGKMKVAIVVTPKFDAGDEWFD
ncbi:MAG: cupin domain-containing protein [Planctomycetota bacterium]